MPFSGDADDEGVSPDTLELLWHLARRESARAHGEWHEFSERAKAASADLVAADRMQADLVRWAVSLGWTANQIRSRFGEIAIDTAGAEGIEL
jgi:hypothetical protein